MADFELTDLLIELEEMQRDSLQEVARGRELSDLLSFYDIPRHLYTLKAEPSNGRDDGQARRTIALFNFGMVEDTQKPALIECLFMMGHSPDFISEALGETIRHVAESLREMVQQHRARRAAQLRENPQRFRLL